MALSEHSITLFASAPINVNSGQHKGRALYQCGRGVNEIIQLKSILRNLGGRPNEYKYFVVEQQGDMYATWYKGNSKLLF